MKYDVYLDAAVDVRDLHQRELRFGGCLVRTSDPPAPFTAARVRFHLPEGTVVEVPGQVVNVVSAAGGFFVQFTPGEELDALHAAIEFVLSLLESRPGNVADAADPERPSGTAEEDAGDFGAEPEELPSADDTDAGFSLEPDDGESDRLDDAPDEPEGPAAPLAGSVRPAWELIDYGSAVPLHKQVADLTVPEKLKLARHATKPIRELLVRDTEKRLHVEVVKNPKVTEAEIAEYSADAQLSPVALRWIAKQRRFARNRLVLNALVTNPATPPDIAVALMASLTNAELQRVARSPRVRENITRAAKKRLMEAGVI